MRSNNLKLSIMISILIIFNLVIGGSSTAFASNSRWSAQAIGNFLENKIDAPNVIQDKKYTQQITREEFAELIIGFYIKVNNIDRDSIKIKDNPFKDTNNLDVQRAYSLGIIKGMSNDTFSPNDNISREQIATMITRFLNIKDINTNSTNNLDIFEDKKDISDWAFDSLAYCVENEIIEGFNVWGEMQLKPKETSTVEQVITVLNRIGTKNNWITQSQSKYISGFFIPSNTKLDIIESHMPGKSIAIKIMWNQLDSIEKLEYDLNYIFNKNPEYKELIEFLTTEKDEYYKDFDISTHQIYVSGDRTRVDVQISEK
ncbi:S-layer-like domain-containing protein [Gottschalkia acidurici 9a]|uniref:S-layer-like domain-containing protein n=1 Tax=Gottschalkia acidurici (strain ATCC 7906 / DSM 604 / BCRC 14475 / CIP 104303 / KCTC 5404 / NCIMB 10678 / 9a) TaxID=1128398 RepID=K0B4B3_GOTA9|nr:S-layer homology domain-containing protein [Gottschalkia acidurici]AFS79775.1 S-layer-like domain-containing protein [Gottschalkia acidurici 9a]